MHVAILGATGTTGKHIVDELLAAEQNVVSRNHKDVLIRMQSLRLSLMFGYCSISQRSSGLHPLRSQKSKTSRLEASPSS